MLTDEQLKSISASKLELTALYRIEMLKRSKYTADQSMSEEQILGEIEDIYKMLRPANKLVRDDHRKNEFVKSFDNSNKDEIVLNQKKYDLRYLTTFQLIKNLLFVG